MTRKIAWLLCLGTFALLAGCNKRRPQAESFNSIATATINHYYDTELSCLWFDPIALPTTGKLDLILLHELEALARQGVLTRAQDKNGPQFQLTAASLKIFRPDTKRPGFGDLCYGKPHVQRITGTERRKDELFGDVTDVEYDSVLRNAPAWTAAPAIQQAFPQMALELSRPLPHSSTLKKTPQGWDVAIGPANSIPDDPDPK
jgi:hypothetical protein